MSLEKLEVCPICNGTDFHPHLICQDFTTSGELFHVEQCEGCSLRFTNPRPSQEEAGQYYKSTSYISHRSAANGIMDRIYLTIRHFTIDWKYRLIKPYVYNKPILDFGCGTGAFLQHCRNKGIETFGIEPSEEARNISTRQELNVSDSLTSLTQNSFDVITLWHVLEHVYNLTDTVHRLKTMLSENGTIFIAVPNWQSPDSTHYQETWAGYDVPRHVWHFSKESMTRLLQASGLKVKEIIPMKLDSYYVSLLSEKYCAGGNLSVLNMARAIVEGLRSNQKARRNTNHSSLIYIVQK